MSTTDRQDLAQVGDGLAMSTTDTRAEQIEALRACLAELPVLTSRAQLAESLLDGPVAAMIAQAEHRGEQRVVRTVKEASGTVPLGLARAKIEDALAPFHADWIEAGQ